jgi:hypothetical protein
MNMKRLEKISSDTPVTATHERAIWNEQNLLRTLTPVAKGQPAKLIHCFGVRPPISSPPLLPSVSPGVEVSWRDGILVSVIVVVVVLVRSWMGGYSSVGISPAEQVKIDRMAAEMKSMTPEQKKELTKQWKREQDRRNGIVPPINILKSGPNSDPLASPKQKLEKALQDAEKAVDAASMATGGGILLYFAAMNENELAKKRRAEILKLSESSVSAARWNFLAIYVNADRDAFDRLNRVIQEFNSIAEMTIQARQYMERLGRKVDDETCPLLAKIDTVSPENLRGQHVQTHGLLLRSFQRNRPKPSEVHPVAGKNESSVTSESK